jgi:hypothetical protein
LEKLIILTRECYKISVQTKGTIRDFVIWISTIEAAGDVLRVSSGVRFRDDVPVTENFVV